MKKYPFVKYPSYHNLIENKSIEYYFEIAYPNIKPPKEPTLDYSSFFDDDNSLFKAFWSYLFLSFIGVSVICGIIFSFFSKDSTNEIRLPVILFFSFLIPIWVVLSSRRQRIKRSLIEREQHETLKRKYEIAKLKYQADLSGFSKSSLFRDLKITKLTDHINIRSNSIVMKLLSQQNQKPIKKGVSEIFFYKMLKKYTDYELYISLQFLFYYPDIIIKHNSGLIIDIEIDEPYNYDDKSPIHYGDIDDDRDNFFLDKGFLIIKFSERQILDFPLKCIQIINEAISYFLNMKGLDGLSERIKEMIDLDFWDYEKAFNLAYNNSRKDVIQKIQELVRIHEIDV